VHFPSVPEETPTNVVVNLVEPLVAVPQRLSTLARTYLNITLSWRDLAGAPLTYALVSQPANGFISGTLPHLTYTPLDTFAGQDRFSFKVDNGVMESLPAEVSILVQPSPLDDIPPEVAWTWPASNTMHVAVRLTPVYTTPAGPVYSPLAYVGFSEPMSATYISTQTVKLLDSAGRTVNASLSYDGTRNQVLLKPHQPLTQPAYTIWISGQVQDLIGNPMGQDYAARFYTSLRRLFYPIIFMKE